MTIVYFVIALSILIVVHEWGHFIVARLSKIRVEKFSIGFGPKIWSIKRGDTEYKISLLPFGGFVKMSGDDLSNLDKNDDQGFYNKSVGTRARVVVAGAMMNIILCCLLMPIVFMIGKSEPVFLGEIPQIVEIRSESSAEAAGLKIGDIIVSIDDKAVSNWRGVIEQVVISANHDLVFIVDRSGSKVKMSIHVEEMPDTRGGYIGVEPPLFIGNEAILDSVNTGSPADKAGLMPGDRVVSANGKPVSSWTDMVEIVGASKGEEVAMEVLRGEKKITVKLLPEYNEDLDRYLIGVSKDLSNRDIPMVKIRYGFFESIKEGFKEVGRLVRMTFAVLKKLVTFQLSYKALGGPIQIAKASAMAAKSGFSSFLFFLSFLSLQLGILNLMPIPVLDGGYLVFFGIEAIRRRPVSEKIQGVAQHVGLALILLLITLVSINDIMQFETIRKIVDKLF